MAHPRKIIREAVKGRLIGLTAGDPPTYATLAEDRVFATMTPIASIENVLQEEGPMIMAYIRGEAKVEYPNQGAGGVWRTLELAIEGLVVGTTDVDDKVDDLAEQIEGRLDAFTVPDFPSGTFHLTETQIDVTDAFGRILGGVSMTYEFRYWSLHRPDDGSNDYLPTEDPATDGTATPDPVGGLPPATLPSEPTPPAAPDAGSNFDAEAWVHGTEMKP